MLTAADQALLDQLAASKAPFYSRKAVAHLLELVARQRHGLQALRFDNAALQMAAFGMASVAEIEAKPGLTPEQREACLCLRRTYDEAQAYRASQQPSPAAADHAHT